MYTLTTIEFLFHQDAEDEDELPQDVEGLPENNKLFLFKKSGQKNWNTNFFKYHIIRKNSIRLAK